MEKVATPRPSIDPDPELNGKTVRVGSSVGLRVVSVSWFVVTFVFLGIPITSLIQALFPHFRSLWQTAVLLSGISAFFFTLGFLAIERRAPLSVATLSPQGVRLRWGMRIRFVPWTLLRMIRHRETLPKWRNVGVWQLFWGPEDAQLDSVRITDLPAVGILRYPSSPRLQLTQKEFEIAKHLEFSYRILK